MTNEIKGYILGHGNVAVGNRLSYLENEEKIHSLSFSNLISRKEIGSSVTKNEAYETTLIGCDNMHGLNSLEKALKNLKNHFYHSCYSGAWHDQ